MALQDGYFVAGAAERLYWKSGKRRLALVLIEESLKGVAMTREL